MELQQFATSADDAMRRDVDKDLEFTKNEVDRLRAEFEMHKGKDFQDLLARVLALEKKLQAVSQQVGGNRGVNLDAVNRIDEDKFNDLAARVSKVE